MVALVDSDEIFVKGMKQLFKEQNIPLNHIVADYNLQPELIKKLSILITDPFKHKDFSIDKVKELVAINSNLRVIIITSIANKTKVDEYIHLGVNAILFKCCKLEEFTFAYFKAIKGECHYCSSVYDVKSSNQNENLEKLTEREMEIAQLIFEGNSTAEIADRFSRSVHTINSHRKNILKKLEIKSPLELLKIMAEL